MLLFFIQFIGGYCGNEKSYPLDITMLGLFSEI